MFWLILMYAYISFMILMRVYTIIQGGEGYLKAIDEWDEG